MRQIITPLPRITDQDISPTPSSSGPSGTSTPQRYVLGDPLPESSNFRRHSIASKPGWAQASPPQTVWGGSFDSHQSGWANHTSASPYTQEFNAFADHSLEFASAQSSGASSP